MLVSEQMHRASTESAELSPRRVARALGDLAARALLVALDAVVAHSAHTMPKPSSVLPLKTGKSVNEVP